MWHMLGYSNNYWWIWMFAAHIIGLLILVGTIVLTIRFINNGSLVQNKNHYNKSLDILNERYVNADINEVEYLKMKKILRK